MVGAPCAPGEDGGHLVSLSAWLSVRPEEVRPVTLSFWGAFLVIAFLVLARSLREALYLTTFPVESLPYVTIAVAVLSMAPSPWITRATTSISKLGAVTLSSTPTIAAMPPA